jgi:hypothetical protein
MEVTESLKAGRATEIEIVGHLNGGGQVTRNFLLDWVVDGLGGADDFQTISFDDQWVDLDSVIFEAVDGVAHREWGMDNIHIGYIPEPSMALLQGLALACIATLARWRRR